MPKRLQRKERFCTICNKWYRCDNDKMVKKHEESATHKAKWRKSVGL